MKKLTAREYEEYWITTHSNAKEDLASVCFPDKPFYFNSFFDRMQRYALNKYIRKERISVERKRVLDIGCGRGRWLFFFEKQYGAIVTGIDLSESAVRACREKGYEAQRGSIIQMPFADSGFDFINSITVLMHLPYELKEKAVREISRVVKRGGKAILIESTWPDPAPHVYGLRVSEWIELFNRYDLNLAHKSAHYFNLFRIKLPSFTPFRNFLAIHLDYPLEYLLMDYYYGKESTMALQHLLVFEKEESK